MTALHHDSGFIPNDQAARDMIRTALDDNMMVEAGAGSGKTTALVGRMLALIARGEPVSTLAAITFTRKAANELRERFQIALEKQLTEATTDEGNSLLVERYQSALDHLDRAFIGTIHAFCGRLLRDHALEVGLDPEFREIVDDEWNVLVRSFWHRWTDRMYASNAPTLGELVRVGIQPAQLLPSFEEMVAYDDVSFSSSPVAMPDVTECKAVLEQLLDDAAACLPQTMPDGGWDSLMRVIRRLQQQRKANDWTDPIVFCRDIGTVRESDCKIVQKRWSPTKDGKEAAKALNGKFQEFVTGTLTDLLREWREYCYPVVIQFLQQAVDAFALDRRETGQLGFNDLLSLSAQILRHHPDVRLQAGRKHRRLLVDEFQDTDPLQADVCFLLASDPVDGNDWRSIPLRPGSLFVVGDPKQSIYRFRRADIQVYETAKAHIARYGTVVALTHNFRSTDSIATCVNQYFESVFPQAATPEQAAFYPMQTSQPPEEPHGVYQYIHTVEGRGKVAPLDAICVASWIAQRIEQGERRPEDFLILTSVKWHIALYARELAARNIPISTAGAEFTQEYELRELCLLLNALTDPNNIILVAAVLEGLFAGCSPIDLYNAANEGIQFSITEAPATTETPVTRALAQMHTWWRLAQQAPADLVLERIIDETGLLYLAACEPLGEARSGVLLHLIAAIRASSGTRAPGLAAAIGQIEAMIGQEADDTPLRPGRVDAVRIMNVHKAKGLEANVVILAAPDNRSLYPPTLHVHRDPQTGTSLGMLVISDIMGQPIAQPTEWEHARETESRFLRSEDERLLYVAATRARQELVVSRCVRSYATKPSEPDTSRWSPLHSVLDTLATRIELPYVEPSPRPMLALSAQEIDQRITHITNTHQRASLPSFTTRTVTSAIKDGPPVGHMSDGTLDVISSETTERTGLGVDWGTAVHRCLDAFFRGRRGADLNRFAMAVAHDQGLSDEESAELLTFLNRIVEEDRIQILDRDGALQSELPIMTVEQTANGLVITEGIIDALVDATVDATMETMDRPTVIDWKTDAVPDEIWNDRLRKYQRQVDQYASMVAALTGTSVQSRVERLV